VKRDVYALYLKATSYTGVLAIVSLYGISPLIDVLQRSAAEVLQSQ
jgi:hypothetical protein